MLGLGMLYSASLRLLCLARLCLVVLSFVTLGFAWPTWATPGRTTVQRSMFPVHSSNDRPSKQDGLRVTERGTWGAKIDFGIGFLGPVDVQREAMIAAARWMVAV